jgi:hypothetical protein
MYRLQKKGTDHLQGIAIKGIATAQQRYKGGQDRPLGQSCETKGESPSTGHPLVLQTYLDLASVNFVNHCTLTHRVHVGEHAWMHSREIDWLRLI